MRSAVTDDPSVTIGTTVVWTLITKRTHKSDLRLKIYLVGVNLKTCLGLFTFSLALLQNLPQCSLVYSVAVILDVMPAVKVVHVLFACVNRHSAALYSFIQDHAII